MRDAKLRETIGEIYGELIVIAEAGKDKHSNRKVAVRCSCGVEKETLAQSLRSGMTRSCGHLQRIAVKIQGKKNATHGHARVDNHSKTYTSWMAMRTRCYVKTNNQYHNYGALGVTVCDSWRDSFEAFLADMGERPSNTSLDRRNPFGNYEPKNCRWATAKEQANNTRKKWIQNNKNS